MDGKVGVISPRRKSKSRPCAAPGPGARKRKRGAAEDFLRSHFSSRKAGGFADEKPGKWPLWDSKTKPAFLGCWLVTTHGVAVGWPRLPWGMRVKLVPSVGPKGQNSTARPAGPGIVVRQKGGLKGRNPLIAPLQGASLSCEGPALRAGLWNFLAFGASCRP